MKRTNILRLGKEQFGMNVYQGKSVFGGIAIGHLCVYKKGEQQVTRQKIVFRMRRKLPRHS